MVVTRAFSCCAVKGRDEGEWMCLEVGLRAGGGGRPGRVRSN